MPIPGISTLLSFLGGAVGSGAGGPITSTVTYSTNAAMPVSLPDYNELVNSFVLGDMSIPTFRELSLIHGKQYGSLDDLLRYTREDAGKAVLDDTAVDRARSPNARVLQGARYLPSIDETKVLLNRGLINDQLAGFIIGRQTTFNPALVDAHLQMRYEIPGPSDLVRFAVRDCFTPEIVSQFQYAKETPVEIKSWMNKQGYGQDIGLDIPANATDAANTPISGKASWFDLYWWSHWELPSPTQGYEMLHRLYPSSDYGPSPFTTPTNYFTEENLSLLLKASDYPQYWRERLTAISYHNLNRSDVIPMYERSLIDEATVYHALRSDGYRDEEAKQLLKLAEYRKNAFLGVSTDKQTKEWICQMYSTGQLDKENALQRLYKIGFDTGTADWFLGECDLKASFEDNKQYIAALKNGYVRGILSQSQVEDQLNLNNFRSDWIERKVNLWTTLKNGKYKQLSALKNIKAYNVGLINRNELIARLQNLQYESLAISTMLGLADYDITQRNLKRVQAQLALQTKAQKQALADQTKANKEAAAKLKATESNIEKFNQKRIRKLIVAFSDKNIIAYWKAKTVELWEVFYRLYYRDFSIGDALTWVKTYMPNLKDEEYANAEIKAQKIYRSEPNPPLV